jgi:hypothetical protein
MPAVNMRGPKTSPLSHPPPQCIRMAWVILYVVLVAVVALTAAFIVLVFQEKRWAATRALGALDGLFGTCLLRMIWFHWPAKKGDPLPHLPRDPGVKSRQ